MKRSTRHVASAAAFVTFVVCAAACGSTSDATSASSTSRATVTAAATAADAGACTPGAPSALPKADAVSGQIRVLAAASLTGAFGDLAKAFEAAYPKAKVATSFGASSGLVAQIHQGAPADVVATADTETMDAAVEGNDVKAPVTFTCNTMAILTAKGNPLHIKGLADLARPDVRFTLCAAPVPCGRLARQVLANAKVDAKPVGSEANVKAVVAKVSQGEVDAGIVYVTDAEAATIHTSSVAIPASVNIVTTYPIAVTRDADRPETAQAFIDFVRSPAGRQVLKTYGFGAS